MTSIRNHNTLDQAAKVLEDLRPNVSAQDRTDAVSQLGISKPTVDRYLLGEAKDIDKAMELIRFFNERIAGRTKELVSIGLRA